MNNIILLGAPGVGKGTYGEKIAKILNLKIVVMGNIVREEAKKKTAFGKKIKETIEKGYLLTDEDITNILKNYLNNSKLKEGIILDGYPRTINQAEILESLIKVNKVVYYFVSEKIIVQRLSSRLICPKCKAVYNVLTMPPKKAGYCDNDNEKLIRRKDDEPESIKKRLKEYEEKTAPLEKFYEDKGILIKIKGEGDPEKVIQKTIEKLKT
ncbi:adenylate kinase [Candidatus Pacearchaeota archaeon CG_4_9_14_3_um_filter_31_7]|nr:MAG: adenylate kinase [Candidatus Pacearchaeota archaeon CG_4_9_14_3_um_filter_31_7]